jgi:hypothetical protein
MSVSHDWLDYANLAFEIVTFVVTAGGLWLVIAALRKTTEQQRIESGPYVRVDIGSTDVATEDFKPFEAYYRSDSQCSDMAPELGEAEKVTLSAWFRNYQRHPLGMALAVEASFLIEADFSGPILNQVRIAYLEVDKPVLVDVIKVPRPERARVTLLALTFLDFYDHRHEHQLGEKSSNALHGRLTCIYDNERIQATPAGRSRGKGVDFVGEEA